MENKKYIKNFIFVIITNSFLYNLLLSLLEDWIYPISNEKQSETLHLKLLSFTECILITVVIYAYYDYFKYDLKKTFTYYMTFFSIPLFFVIQYFFFKISSLRVLLSTTENQKEIEKIVIDDAISSFILIVLTGPFLEEFFFRKLLYRSLRGNKRLSEAINDGKFFLTLKIMILMIFSASMFAALHVHQSHNFVNEFVVYFYPGLFLVMLYEIFDSFFCIFLTHHLWNFINYLITTSR